MQHHLAIFFLMKMIERYLAVDEMHMSSESVVAYSETHKLL